MLIFAGRATISFVAMSAADCMAMEFDPRTFWDIPTKKRPLPRLLGESTRKKPKKHHSVRFSNNVPEGCDSCPPWVASPVRKDWKSICSEFLKAVEDVPIDLIAAAVRETRLWCPYVPYDTLPAPSGLEEKGVYVRAICNTILDASKVLGFMEQMKERKWTLLLGLPELSLPRVAPPRTMATADVSELERSYTEWRAAILKHNEYIPAVVRKMAICYVLRQIAVNAVSRFYELRGYAADEVRRLTFEVLPRYDSFKPRRLHQKLIGAVDFQADGAAVVYFKESLWPSDVDFYAKEDNTYSLTLNGVGPITKYHHRY